MKIAIIVAVAKNNVIGGENKLLWHLPADLKHFKNLTTGHCIVMGRKTYESIGRPLPNRTNIIISRNDDFKAEGCVLFKSLEKAMESAQELEQNGTIFIIGGGNVYKQAMPLADEIYVTDVDLEIEGDTYFPAISPKDWTLEESNSFEPDEKNKLNYSFKKYVRK